MSLHTKTGLHTHTRICTYTPAHTRLQTCTLSLAVDLGSRRNNKTIYLNTAEKMQHTQRERESQRERVREREKSVPLGKVITCML